MSDAWPSPAERSEIAARILRKSLGVRSGENVMIEGWTFSQRWADAFALESWRIGARPFAVVQSESAFWDAVEEGGFRSMREFGAHERSAIASTDAFVYLPGPEDRARLRSLSAAMQALLDDWDEQWFRIARQNQVRGCRVELAATTEKMARFYGVDLGAWREELLAASKADLRPEDRIARRIARRLEHGRRLSITHPNGTRLDLGLRGLRPRIETGRIDRESARAGRVMTVVPTGFLIVAIDERYGEGPFLSNRPSRHFRGTIDRIRWTFHAGRLVDHEVGVGGELFEESYREAPRARDRPGLFALGLNPELRDAPLQEDLGRGIVTVYTGCNEDFGGRTGGSYREYALLEGADVKVDGRSILEKGKLV